MDIKDTQIARVPVRIYTPKHLLKENAKKSTGVIFLHGGGFMLGSVGKTPPIIIFFKHDALL